MIDSIRGFFSEDGFMPHGHCYLWQPGVLWLHIVSDALIVLAYFSIPFTLLYFVHRRTDLEFNWMFVCFALFIVACGATHLMEIWTIWHPTYWLAGGVKAITALASVPTAILLAKLIPDALQLPSPAALQKANAQLHREVDERKRAEDDVRRMNRELESRVAERTQALETINRSLVEEIGVRQRAQENQKNAEQRLQNAYEDLRKTQRVILQQERLGALGQIASGIAHDINNAISPITLYTASLLEREPDLSDRARDQIGTIQRAIEDVAQTVARMREFYRQREPELVLARIDPNRIAKEAIDLTHARWSDVPQQKGVVIDLRTDLSSDLPDTVGAEHEIRDALTNLIFNAVDAMPEGGTLTLRTISIRRSDAAVRYACVEVRDTGVGMDEETRRRCLEPFFTTKGERGTGLGLAMVYGMVQRHSAELEIDSEPGKGTTMRLIFPAAAPTTMSPVPLSKLQAPVQPLRILLVDDDPMVIRSLKDALEGDGHLITAAAGGEAGIDTFIAAEKRGEPFAVVITDLGMPHVDGRRVAAAVREASPDTHIILLTGWGQRLIADNDVPPQVDRVLSKPPKLRELRTVLAEFSASRARALFS